MNQSSQASHQHSELVAQEENSEENLREKGQHLTRLISVFSLKS